MFAGKWDMFLASCNTYLLMWDYLSPVEFRDEIRRHCGLKFLSTHSFCDGRGCECSDSHALSCKVGGLAYSRYDEGRDALGFLACRVFQLANSHDEYVINPCRDLARLSPNAKLI